MRLIITIAIFITFVTSGFAQYPYNIAITPNVNPDSIQLMFSFTGRNPFTDKKQRLSKYQSKGTFYCLSWNSVKSYLLNAAKENSDAVLDDEIDAVYNYVDSIASDITEASVTYDSVNVLIEDAITEVYDSVSAGGAGELPYYEAHIWITDVGGTFEVSEVWLNTFPNTTWECNSNSDGSQNGFEIHATGSGITFAGFDNFGSQSNIFYGQGTGELVHLLLYGNGLDNIGIVPTELIDNTAPSSASMVGETIPITIKWYHE